MCKMHYKYMPIVIKRKFHLQKLEILDKNSHTSHISAQNIYCGYSLYLPRPGGSNEYMYPQSIFFEQKKNIMYTPINPSFTL